MNRIIHRDFSVKNGRGVLLFTSPDPELAKRWAKDNAHLHNGLTVNEDTLSSRTIYKPRQRKAFDFSIPMVRA